MNKFLEALSEGLSEYAKYIDESNRRIVETKSSTRADDLLRVVVADTLRYCHRNEYLEAASYLDGFERSLFLMKLRRVDYSLWRYISSALI